MAVTNGTTSIANYKVRVSLDDKGQGSLSIDLIGNPGQQVGTIYLTFFPGGKGGWRASSGNILFNVSDRELFYPIYRILQSEKPLYAQWQFEQSDGVNKVNFVWVSTDAEPAGELEHQ